jgi:hypothetical protein
MMRKIQRPILSQVTNIRLISTVQSARLQSFETEVLAQEETAHEMHTIRILVPPENLIRDDARVGVW